MANVPHHLLSELVLENNSLSSLSCNFWICEDDRLNLKSSDVANEASSTREICDHIVDIITVLHKDQVCRMRIIFITYNLHFG